MCQTDKIIDGSLTPAHAFCIWLGTCGREGYISLCVCIKLLPTRLSLCPAVDSVVVPEEGSGVTTAHTPSDWLESEEFEAMPSDPIFMSADKFTKTPPAGTLSRVGCRFTLLFHSAHTQPSDVDLSLRQVINIPCV